MENCICTFDELSIGEIFKYGGVTCIKTNNDEYFNALCWLSQCWLPKTLNNDQKVEQTFVRLEDIFKGEDI